MLVECLQTLIAFHAIEEPNLQVRERNPGR